MPSLIATSLHWHIHSAHTITTGKFWLNEFLVNLGLLSLIEVDEAAIMCIVKTCCQKFQGPKLSSKF